MNDEDLTRLNSSGFFCAIDVHFARLLSRLNREAVPELVFAAAMVSRSTREGHICLNLREVAGKSLANDPEALLCPNLLDWSEKLLESAVVGRPGEYKPLILDHGHRLYLYRYWRYQHNLAEAIKARLAGPPPGGNTAAFGGAVLPSLLDRLFPSPPGGDVDWQKVAALAALSKTFCVISGGPGTGKTTTVAKILALLLEHDPSGNRRVAMAAPTGKAAARLEEAIKDAKQELNCPKPVKQAIPETASTIHRLLGAIQGSPYFRHHEGNPLPVDVLVVDEASMVDLALMSKLFQALPPSARVVLLGDKDQLASVEAGAVLGDICETGERASFSEDFVRAVEVLCSCRLDREFNTEHPTEKPKDCIIQLQKSYRFSDASGIGLLSQKVRDSDVSGAMTILEAEKFRDVSWHKISSGSLLADSIRSQVSEGFRDYFQEIEKIRFQPGGEAVTRIQEVFRLLTKFRILCAVREGFCGVAALNDLVEHLFEKHLFLRKDRAWYVGRPILISRNDYNLRLFNGDVGIFLPDLFTGTGSRVFFAGPEGRFRAFHPLRLPEHETVYAVTVHKSQGSEFSNVMFILPDRDSPLLTRELVYTAITRAKERVSLWGQESVFRTAVSRSTRRLSGLSDELWRNSGQERRSSDQEKGCSSAG